MKALFRKGPERDFFFRGTALGVIAMAGVTVAADAYREARIETIVEQAALEPDTPAQEAAEILRQALDLSDQMMNREITSDDIPLIVTGALQAIDPYGGYVEKEMSDRITGESDIVSEKFMIGVLGDITEDGYVVRSTMPMSPADGVGLLPGDILVAIGDRDVSDLAGEEALEALREATQESGGAAMDLRFDRDGETVTVTISPEHLPESYAYDMGREDGILHLRVTSFMNGVAEDVERLIERHAASGELRGVIFDLRGNAGGLTTETRRIAELVLPAGTLLYSEDGLHIGAHEVSTGQEPKFPGLSVSTIVDEHSASASEIFASALQANDLGMVIGEISYGKGTIQNVYPFSDGSGALKITVGEYKDAKGRTINEVGVIPDILVEGEEEASEKGVDPAFDAAFEHMKQCLEKQAAARRAESDG